MKTFNLSIGHSKNVSGANGFVKEHPEAYKIGKRVYDILTNTYNGSGRFYRDTTSTTQDKNLDNIVAFHNKKVASLEISVHLNSGVSSATGSECLYYDKKALANKMSKVMANALKIKDRGGKERKELAFLRRTDGKAILLECFFVSSMKDVTQYKQHFEALCSAIARCVAEELGYTKSPSNVHIVAQGENLTKIANEYNTTVQKIRDLNGIKNTNLIYIGQKLQIR